MADPLQPGDPFHVAMLLFPGITQLDLTGPHEVLKRLHGITANADWGTSVGAGALALGAAGIDFALGIIARLRGPESAPPALLARMTAAMAAYQERSATALHAAAVRL